MMFNTRKIFAFHTLLCILTFFFPEGKNVFAQNKPEKDSVKIKALARMTGDEVWLRWSVSSPSLWKKLAQAKIGYNIERVTVEGEKVKTEKITEKPLVPYALEEWKKLDTENVHINGAAEALYGDVRFNPKSVKSPFAAAENYDNEVKMRYAYAMLAADFNRDAATALGLFFRDDLNKNAVSAKNIYYRIYVSGKADFLKNVYLDTAVVWVNTEKKYVPQAVIGVMTEEGEHAVTLAWDKEGNKQFSAFDVERAEAGKDFVKLNANPLMTDEEAPFNFYIDSLSQNYVKYRYRIVGYTPFGDRGAPSEVVTAQGIDLSPAAGFGEIHTQTQADGSVKIIWKSLYEQPDLEGFYVAKSLDIENEFIYINEKPVKGGAANNLYEFTDKNPEKVFNSYYTVYAHDLKGNRSRSMTTLHILSDDTPPAKPTGLRGEIDSAGVVKLTWEEGKEADLLGYRIYYAHALDREFIPLTPSPIADNVFFDTLALNTLTEKIYYKILANDLRYNASPYSDILVLSKPDTIAPTVPFITFFEVNDKGILIDFRRSSSEDVVKHEVLRRAKAGEKWESLKVLTDTTHRFLDEKVSKGVWYEYAVVAHDDAKNISPAENILPIQFYNDGKRNSQPVLKAEYLKKDKLLRLSWTSAEKADHKVLIFRAEKGEEKILLTSLTGSEFIDYGLFDNGKGFEYAVKFLYEDGSESAISNTVRIDLK
jgi:hypothetical protein